MRRLEVTDKQRDEIVTLREGGTKWTEIQRLTKIDRRTAKNIYENWERNSSVEELQKVRKEVAAAEFRSHLESIIELAVSLISNLNVPRSIDNMKNSEEFLMWLWEQDLVKHYYPPKPQQDDYTGVSQGFFIRDPHIYLDENKLLYKSLREHTRGEVNWSIFDNDWKNAMDKCAKNLLQLQAETRQLIDNYLQNTKEPRFLERVKKTTKENDPAKNVTRAIVNGIWILIMQNNPIGELLFETASRDTTSVDVVVKFGDGTSGGILLRLVGSDRQYLAENITKQCNSAIRILSDKIVVKELFVEVGNIRRASDTFREMLNPLKLSPMILRTRCDLCPA
jgi:hypothetical protein